VVRKILRATANKFLQIVASIEQFGDMKTMSIEEVIERLRAYVRFNLVFLVSLSI
jgi:hypothetical protein